MIVFQNDGELDLRCVTTMGVNVKETDNAIGHFGTGLKYAIATWLRNDCKVTINIGSKSYEFFAEEEDIRGKTFKMVCMSHLADVCKIGFTTELGKNWEPWMAFREMYSNMLDEPNGKMWSTRKKNTCLVNGKTQVIVQGNAVNSVYANRHKYFLSETDRDPVYSFLTAGVDFYERVTGGEPTVFYRGIRVGTIGNGSQFDYNLTADTVLTEDRTLRFHWEVDWAIGRAMLRLTGENKTDRDILRRMLTAPLGSFEAKLDYVHGAASPTDFFLDIVAELREEASDTHINPSALALLFKARKNTDLPTRSVKLNNVQEKQLEKAIAFCTNVLEFEELPDLPIIICENLGKGHLGRADMDDDKIYIAKKCFEQGTKRIAVALLEEYTHIKHKVEDETLEQKWVYLEQIISLGERIQGEPL